MNKAIYKQTLFDKETFRGQLAYWWKIITPQLKAVELPVDVTAPAEMERAVDAVRIMLPGELAKKTIHFSQASDLTLYVVLLTAFKAFLFRCTKNDEILIAPPLLKLDHGVEVQQKYNKRILLRDAVNTALTFKELLIETKNKTLEAFKNQNYPLDLVFKKRNLDIQDYPFIDRVVFLLKNLHHQEDIQDLEYDLLFSFSREGENIAGEILFNRQLFKRETIEQLGGRYLRTLACGIQNIHLKIKELDILSAEERRQLLYEWNNTRWEYPKDKTIQRLFEEQVEKTPGAVAAVGIGHRAGRGEEHLTYLELNKRANQLARCLRRKGVAADVIVALMMEPGVEMMIGIMGILKAGGTYLPVDPFAPEKRVYFLLRDAGVSVVLTYEQVLRDFSFTALQNLENWKVEPLVTPQRPLVENLDSLQMPDRSYIDYEKYHPYIGQSMIKDSIVFQFSRGCVYKCAYCFKIWPNNRHIHRSAENMFEELLFYYKMGVRKFSFVDDLFNFDIKECAKFYKLVIQNRLKVHLAYPNGLRGDILTRELIDLMVEAGTISLDVALETSSRRLQKLIGKNLNLDKLHENICYMMEKHPQLILETQLLHGIPTETEEEAQASLDYLKSLKWIHFPYLHVLKIYPGTDMAKLAVEHGIPAEAIEASDHLGYNELPETLPFPVSFTHRYQSEFASEYFMSRERLAAVLPYQISALSEDELVQKYNSFLPVTITCFADLLDYVGIQRQELAGNFLPDDYGRVPNLDAGIREQFPRKDPLPDALRVLLIDVSAYFSGDRRRVIYDVVEPSLGLMYLMTHLERTFAHKVKGKIVSSRIDYDSFEELRTIIHDFKPDVIGIRSLNFYKKFFHKTVSLIRQWGVKKPIIAGGPYATSSFRIVLKDAGVDLVVLGEGEITFAEIIGRIMENGKKLPGEEILRTIQGIAFIESKNKQPRSWHTREILLMTHLFESLSKESCRNLEPVNTPTDLAYIIYTSGSTGIPKGVLVQHHNLVNQVCGLVKTFHFDASHHYILLAATTFDVSIMHIFLPLTTGAKLFLMPDRVKKDPFKLWQLIHDSGIDILNIVPAFMKALLENMDKKKFYFKYLFVGGDVFDKELYHRLKETFRVEHIFNIYGPTETTINAALYRCIEPELEMRDRIPIGKPLPNYKAFILDSDLNPVPIGVKGELCFAGDGAARGYLNHQELTREKFVKNPHQTGELMYRTGDLARWLTDGNIEFLGRIDQQVKIRGFRIEPGEIEKQLLNYHGIRQAIVVARQDKEGEKYLCAYAAANGDFPAESQIKEYLSKKLPGYMVPNDFVKLENIPLTSTGKVDLEALPDPVSRSAREYAPPRDEVEEILTELWADVVGMNKANIGIDSDFFALGGHSLKATILVSKIHKRLDVHIPIVVLFKAPTIRKLAVYIKEAAKERYQAIEAVEKKECYPLSSAQKRLYILQQMEIDSSAYNLPALLRMDGEMIKNKLEMTFLKLINRHESLRTSFEMTAGEPIQRLHDRVDFKIQYYHNESSDPSQGVEPVIRKFIHPFDLSQAPLFRVGLLEEKGGTYILMIDMHHIISDGVSLGVLVKEFMECYAGKELPVPNIQYKDFSVWQYRDDVRESIKKQEAYWLEQFRGEIPVLNLPLDFRRPAIQRFEGSIIHFEIGKQETEALRKYASGEKATLFMMLLAVYNIFLNKLGNLEDIVVGAPIAGRRGGDLEEIVGMFVNTLALRNFPYEEKNFNLFLGEVNQRALQAFENQDYPYEELVEKVAAARDAGRNPMFDVMFALQNIEIPEIDIPGLKLKPCNYHPGISKFDLTLQCIERDENLQCAFEYCTKLFKPGTIARFINYFKKLVSIVIETPGIKISGMDILPVEEKQKLLYDFNEIEMEYPGDKTIHELFEEQVRRTPDGIALQMTNRTYRTYITYNQLRKKSNQLAHFLNQKGVRPDNIIGLMVERSVEMVIGLLGILKSGGAYLPIDLNYPGERINYMLADSSAKVLLSEVSKVSEVSGGVELVRLSELRRKFPTHPTPLTPLTHPTHLSYVIYTSGSTGRPKGVPVRHRGFINLVHFYRKAFGLCCGDRVSQVASPGFDAMAFEVWPCLLSGGTLVIADDETRADPGKMVIWLIKNQIAVSFQSTVMTEHLISEERPWQGSALRVLKTGGEQLTRYPASPLPFRVYNLYGPTEDTVWTTWNEVRADMKPAHRGEQYPTIGKPIANHRVYITGNRHKLQPIGVAGELCIAGHGLAVGYLNRPELTAEKFINPGFPPTWRGRMIYKTGDLARWLANGEIEFLGRIDHQVKIRGFRIELGEIEHQLLSHEEIKNALVVVKMDNRGDKYLCAYIVPGMDPGPGGSDLREFLAEKLPDHMIPAYFVTLAHIPLTANGKVDRKALPEPEIPAGKGYVAPRNKLEERLVEIWSEVLALEKGKISINADFFHLGGHSLKATILAARIHKELDVKLPLAQVFNTPNIKGLAEYIKTREKKKYQSIQPVEKKEYYLLSSAQKRMYILQQIEPRSIAYNISTLVQLDRETKIHKKKLEQILRLLMRRHDSFRTSFTVIHEEPVQRIQEQPPVDFVVEYVDLPAGEKEPVVIENIFKDFVRPFCLSKAPLVRVGLIGEYILMVDMHHIISDGMSHDIVRRDFLALLRGQALTPLPLQYKDYAQWQHSEAVVKSLRRQEQYWLEEYKEDIPLLSLPLDYERGTAIGFEGDTISFAIAGRLFEKVKERAGEFEVTLMIFLFSIYNILLARYAGREELVVGTVAAGRQHADLENIIGFFVNMLPIKTGPCLDNSFSHYLSEVKQKAVNAYENQGYPFEELVSQLDIPREPGRHPLVDAVFVFQGDVEAVPQEPQGFNIANFDLMLQAAETPGSIQMFLRYSTALFKHSTIEEFAAFYRGILEQVVENPHIHLKDINVDLHLATSSSPVIQEQEEEWGL